MNHDDTDMPEVLEALRNELDDVTMRTPVEKITAAGCTRLYRRRLASTATAVAAVGAVAIGVMTYANPAAAPPGGSDAIVNNGPQMQPVGFTVNQKADGTVDVTWDKQRYFDHRAALEAALKAAGFPVVMKVGEFCAGPNDDTTLNPSGEGPGVGNVMKGKSEADGKVTFTFLPSAMPAGKELFIGYLSPAQLAATKGDPGSVERLVSTGVPLTCTTTPPPPDPSRVSSQTDKKAPADGQAPADGVKRR
jgi:hypothetical protein